MKQLRIQDKDKLWITSDCHFGHRNIIKYCSRPFDSAVDMDVVLKSNWCERVKDDDDIVILGDLCWFQTDIPALLEYLPGRKHLVRGNHDKHLKCHEHLFTSVHDMLDLRVVDPEGENGRQHIFCCHYPMLSWDGSDNTVIQAHGHIHTLRGPDGPGTNGKRVDVGVDNWNYAPVSYNELMRVMRKTE